MDTTVNLNAAMRYIEQRLFDVIDFTEVARIACCSEYQFRRMFSYLADMALNEYIRKRRLSIAAGLLQTSEEKIIDISLRCGYESPDAFGKAFQAMYGVSPSALRKSPDKLKAFPPLFFHLTLKGGIEMDYRVVEKDAFYVMGKSGRIPLIFHGNNPHFDTVWQKLKNDGILVLTEYAKCEPSGVVEVYADMHINEGEDFTLYVGIVMETPMPAHFKGRFDVLAFEASTWLVFTAVDNTTRDGVYWAVPSARKQMHKQISEWLPTSEYEQVAPQIISFLSYDACKPDLKSEIWVPVRKRSI